MKKLLALLFISSSLSSYSQHSNYYTVDVTGNVTVNKNIRTIDYGQSVLIFILRAIVGLILCLLL